METRKNQFTKSEKVQKPNKSRLVQSCNSISYGEIKRERNKNIKTKEPTCPRDKSYPTPPRISKTAKPILEDETNKLAEQWCQMLIDQVQETRSK